MTDERPVAVSLQLVDPVDGRSLQVWSFTTNRITIGRGGEESIVLADPYISRVHAELICDGGVWELISRGRNGVIVDGKLVAASPLAHGATFRLGQNGPTFRFGNVLSQSGTSTLCFDPESFIPLAVNRQIVEQEARQIAETDYFRGLQQKARELRSKRASDVTR